MSATVVSPPRHDTAIPTEIVTSAEWDLTLALDAPARVIPAGLPFASRGHLSLFIEGQLFDRLDLARALGVKLAEGDAKLVLTAFERWGVDALDRLRGRFAVVVLDRDRDQAFIGHDPLGAHPVFLAEHGRNVYAATHPQRLLRLPGVSQDLNLPMLADHLCRRHGRADETFFAGVRRLPAGYRAILTGGRMTFERCWAPLPADEPLEFLSATECAAFDEVFGRAVSRTVHARRSAIYLSGGLDSSAIAAVATDLAHAQGTAPPIALSLVLPHPTCDEHQRQTAVARELDLPQHSLEFHEALGDQSLLAQALTLTRRLPSPLANVWTPPYLALARSAARQGIETVLWGEGGDEWLAVAPSHAADLLAQGDLLGWHQFAEMWRTSEGVSTSTALRLLGWKFGLRPLAGRWLSRMAPTAWDQRRASRLLASDPAWIAPDPSLRAAQEGRAASSLGPADPSRGFRCVDLRVDDSTTATLLDEMYFVGELTGMRFLMPFFDPDLVALVSRMPPAELNAGGRLRGLQRQMLSSRLPNLGYERQTKILASSFYQSTLEAGRTDAIEEVGGLSTLAALGVVDGSQAEAVLTEPSDSAGELRFWDLLNLEAWARSYVN